MRSNTVGWLMLAPTIAILGIFGIIPFIYVLYVAFHQWNPFGASPDMIYNGANNFRRLVFDTEFLTSIAVTIKFGFFAVVSEIALGYLLAQLFMREFPGRGFFRTIHTLPLIVAPIATPNTATDSAIGATSSSAWWRAGVTTGATRAAAPVGGRCSTAVMPRPLSVRP